MVESASKRQVFLEVSEAFESTSSIVSLDQEHKARIELFGKQILKISDGIIIYTSGSATDPKKCWVPICSTHGESREFERSVTLNSDQEEIIIYLRIKQTSRSEKFDIVSFSICWQNGYQMGYDGKRYPQLNYFGWTEGTDLLTIKQLKSGSNPLFCDKHKVTRGIFAFGNIFNSSQCFLDYRGGNSTGGYQVFYGWENTREGVSLFDY